MKAVLQYFVLLSVSVLGILGIMQLGQGLKAPASVGGVWSLQWANPESVKSNCPSVPFEAETPELLISQSGREVVITFHDATRITFSGKLREMTIDARAKRHPSLHMVASIDRQVEPDQLQGVLTSNQCAAAINFTGIRQAHLPSLTGEH